MSAAILISPQEINLIYHVMDSYKDHDDKFDHSFKIVTRDSNEISSIFS